MKSKPASATRSSSEMICAMRHVAAVGFGQKATAPVIRAEGFRVATGPNLHAAIAHHLELRCRRRSLCLARRRDRSPSLSSSRETHRRPPVPSSLALRSAADRFRRQRLPSADLYFAAFRVCGVWPTRCDHSLGKFLRADLLLALAFFVNVVSVNAIFDRSQPGVVHALGDCRSGRCGPASSPRPATTPTDSPDSVRRGAAPIRESLQTSRRARRCSPNPPDRPSRQSAPPRPTSTSP